MYLKVRIIFGESKILLFILFISLKTFPPNQIAQAFPVMFKKWQNAIVLGYQIGLFSF